MSRNGIVHLDCWSIRIFSLLGIFVRFDLYPLGFLPNGAYVHFGFSLSSHVIAWWECWLSTPVPCDQMNRNGIVHLDCWNIRIFSLLGVLSASIFILTLWILSNGAFVHFSFSLSTYVIAWQECWLSTPVSCDLMNRNRIVHLDCWSIRIFFLLWGFVRFDFILWGFCPMLLLSILAFLCLFMWSHGENVDCPHLYHVIRWTEIGSYTLIVGILEYFLFWGFCPLRFLSFRAFVQRCFCPFWLFSIHPRDHMMRILIVHTCIMWSHEQKWDRTPWLSEYWNIFSFLGVLSAFIFILWGFCPMVFCPFWLFSVRPRDCMSRMLIVHTCTMWSHEQKWDCTPRLLEY